MWFCHSTYLSCAAMSVFTRLSMFALAPLVGGVARATGGASADGVVRFLNDRLSDQSLRVAEALSGSADRAWKTLEVALAGESVRNVADRADDKAFREQVRLFVLNAQFDGRATADPGFVGRCLGEHSLAETSWTSSARPHSKWARSPSERNRSGS